MSEEPIKMILYCPKCRHQHIDLSEWRTKPHRTHLCSLCGHLWRPANIPTVGVGALPNIDTLSGVQLIIDERRRQILKGFTPQHDDIEHDNDELAWAAICYAAPDKIYVKAEGTIDKPEITFKDPWPWDDGCDARLRYDVSTQSRIKLLVKAGALIVAEIERLNRAKNGNSTQR